MLARHGAVAADRRRTQNALGDAWRELGRFARALGCPERVAAPNVPAINRDPRHAPGALAPNWQSAMLNDAQRIADRRRPIDLIANRAVQATMPWSDSDLAPGIGLSAVTPRRVNLLAPIRAFPARRLCLAGWRAARSEFAVRRQALRSARCSADA